MYDFLSYRTIKDSDAPRLLAWRTSPEVARHMLSQVPQDLGRQVQWIRDSAGRADFQHRIIRIEGRDVGYCSITVRDAAAGIGELGVYIGEPDTPRELSIFNFLGTANHALFTLGLNKLVNRIVETNPRTLRLQAFNGYLPAGVLPGAAEVAGQRRDVHLFELTRERWHEFRKKFAYFKDWDGNST